jgi:hypothetical protein
LPDVNGRSDSDSLERRDNLERAVRTLRAIQQRYETGRNARPDARCYSVQMAVGYGDMAWIAAAIEALETSVTDVTETAIRSLVFDSDVAATAIGNCEEKAGRLEAKPALASEDADRFTLQALAAAS